MAGRRLAADLPVAELAPFALAVEAAPPGPAPATAGDREIGIPVYAGPGWVGGRLRQVESRRLGGGYLLRIEDAGELTVRADGAEIACRPPVSRVSPGGDLAAAVLGPCLPMALALQGTWCLHAGAAGTARFAVALAGESGSGKSTLAAALATAGGGWRRVGDDLLPMRLEGDAAWALPRFPQPNLPADDQWCRPAPPELDLAAIYLLEPGAGEVEIRALRGRAAVLALVRHTVAARLFDGDLQARHLDACAELAGRVPIRTLRFPRRLEALPAMAAAIVAAG